MTGEPAGQPPRSFKAFIHGMRYWPRDLSRLLRGKARNRPRPVLERTPRAARRSGAIISPAERASLAAGEAKLAASVRARLARPDLLQVEIEAYAAARGEADRPRIAVFTAIAGGYDSLKLPDPVDPRFDYVVFSDRPLPETKVWQVRPMTWLDADPTRSCRFVKTRPHVLLAEYDYAIWIDSNVMIVGDLFPLFNGFAASGLPVGGIRHPFRKRVRDELAACRGRDDEAIMQRQVESYGNSGAEVLIETNLMVFDLRQPQTAAFLDTWWREIDRHSRRDQLSVGHALVATETRWHPLMPWPESTRTHPTLACVDHDGGAGPAALLTACLHAPPVYPFAGPAWAGGRERAIATHAARRLDVVVCVHNALEHVRACLDSVRRHRRHEAQRLVLVDDGSAEATRAYLEDFARGQDWVTLLRNDVATGYTRAANRGLRATSGELAILLNSDTVVTEGWAEKLAETAWSAPRMGIVGPLSNAASHQSLPDHRDVGAQTAVNSLPPGLTPDDMNRFCEQMATVGRVLHVPLVHGFCMGIRREVLERIGGFDETHFPEGYGEENDFCFRATDAGFGIAIASHTYVHHAKSRSYAENRRVLLFRRSVETLRTLYGARVDRALETVRQNPVLAEIRHQASLLHALHAE